MTQTLTVQQLKAARTKALAVTTSTDAEYREKWTRINELTRQIALANGATEKELRAY